MLTNRLAFHGSSGIVFAAVGVVSAWAVNAINTMRWSQPDKRVLPMTAATAQPDWGGADIELQLLHGHTQCSAATRALRTGAQ